jgi:hypothetical protein
MHQHSFYTLRKKTEQRQQKKPELRKILSYVLILLLLI